MVQIKSPGLYNDELEAGLVIFNNLRQRGQIRNALRCNDTMLGQMCSKGIDKLRSLTNEESRVRKPAGVQSSERRTAATAWSLLQRSLLRAVAHASIATVYLGSSLKKVTTWPRDSFLRKITLPSLLVA